MATFYFETLEFETESGHKVLISRYREKYDTRDFWRVDYVITAENGLEWGYTYKSGLLRKPNKKQIQNYIETL